MRLPAAGLGQKSENLYGIIVTKIDVIQQAWDVCWVVNLFITLTNHLPSFMSKSLVWNNQKENQAKLTQRKRGCQQPHLISIMCSLVPLHIDAFF